MLLLQHKSTKKIKAWKVDLYCIKCVLAMSYLYDSLSKCLLTYNEHLKFVIKYFSVKNNCNMPAQYRIKRDYINKNIF